MLWGRIGGVKSENDVSTANNGTCENDVRSENPAKHVVQGHHSQEMVMRGERVVLSMLHNGNASKRECKHDLWCHSELSSNPSSCYIASFWDKTLGLIRLSVAP